MSWWGRACRIHLHRRFDLGPPDLRPVFSEPSSPLLGGAGQSEFGPDLTRDARAPWRSLRRGYSAAKSRESLSGDDPVKAVFGLVDLREQVIGDFLGSLRSLTRLRKFSRPFGDLAHARLDHPLDGVAKHPLDQLSSVQVVFGGDLSRTSMRLISVGRPVLARRRVNVLGRCGPAIRRREMIAWLGMAAPAPLEWLVATALLSRRLSARPQRSFDERGG